jgi:hypothetical protein
MKRTGPIEIIEGWLADGPTAAPDRIVARLPDQLRETRQARERGILRSTWIVAPIAAAAVTLAVAVLSGGLRPPAGDHLAPDIPPPPTPFAQGDRVDILLQIENRSDRPYGSWYWSGSSGGMPTAMPCQAILVAEQIRAPGVIRFGEVHPETEEPMARESLPVLLDTDALPGSPIAYRDDIVPVWTYAYLIAVSEDGGVLVEPLGASPSVEDAGPICPTPDTSWPGGWPMIQAWLADQLALPDCGVVRNVTWPQSRELASSTSARRCFYDAWLDRRGAQITTISFTNHGPLIEIMRTSDGTVEMVSQDLRPPASGQLRVVTCARLVPPSQLPGFTHGPDIDEAMVFMIDVESCSRAEP